MPKTTKEIEKILLKKGWYLDRKSNGSHRQYKHPDKIGMVTISFHNKDIPISTLKNICKQARLDWRKYK